MKREIVTFEIKFDPEDQGQSIWTRSLFDYEYILNNTLSKL